MLWRSSLNNVLSLLLLPFYWNQIFSAPCSQTPSNYILTLVRDTDSHTHKTALPLNIVMYMVVCWLIYGSCIDDRIYCTLIQLVTTQNTIWHTMVFLLNHLRLPSSETPPIIISVAWDPRYIASGRPQQKPVFRNNSFILIGVCLARRCVETAVFFISIHFRGNMFIESLPSNERLLLIPYSSFQASCHNMLHVSVSVLIHFNKHRMGVETGSEELLLSFTFFIW
jgi:hypothetical protein